MPKAATSLKDTAFLAAALEGLELQKSRIESQIQQVRALLKGRAGKPQAAAAAKPARKKRELSAAARRRIAMAQKKRWAEYRKQKAAAAA